MIVVVVVIKHFCLHYSYENNAKERELQPTTTNGKIVVTDKWWLSVKTPSTQVPTTYHVFFRTQLINIPIEGKLDFSFGPNEKWVHVIAQYLANNNLPLGYIYLAHKL